MIEKISSKPHPAGTRHGLPIWRAAIAGMAVIALAGCASLPTSGPTVSQVRKGVDEAVSVPYRIVPIDAEVVKNVVDTKSVGVLELASLSDDRIYARSDVIRPGDTLSIAIFEVGVSLFASAAAPGAALDPSRAPGASVQTITVLVREDGNISLPYLGTISAVGAFPEALALTIRQRLKPISESPEVLVNIADTVEGAVYIGGTVARSGRVRLTAARERLLDALALAGGSPIDVNELQVTLVRGSKTVVAPLNQIGPGDPANVMLFPGDRIVLERVRQTFTIFGATDRINQIPFESRKVTLAEALARAAGPSDWRANPRGVFLFRLEKDEKDEPRATVYQLNMLQPEAYFVAQMFPVRDKDVILIANSSSNLTQKLVGLVNQLFSPILAARYAAQ